MRMSRRYSLFQQVALTVLVIGFVCCGAGHAVAANPVLIDLWLSKPVMTVNGVSQNIDAQLSTPVVVDGRTLVPIRAIIEAVGGSIAWNATDRKATLSLGSSVLDLWIGKASASLNGKSIAIDASNPKLTPIILKGRTLLPLRFVSEALGMLVGWEQQTKMITVAYGAPSKDAIIYVTDTGNKFHAAGCRYLVKGCRSVLRSTIDTTKYEACKVCHP
jgi:hypothetical protein